MATITIGGRELQLRPDAGTLGFERNKLIPWQKKLFAARDGEVVVDTIVEGILLYVEGVDADWILSHVKSTEVKDVLGSCAEAAGRKAGAPGEAEGP